MAGTFVPVPREAIVKFLEHKGFIVDDKAEGHELVYKRAHKKNANLFVMVYTSLNKDPSYDTARERGKDAIRIFTFYHNPNTGARKKISEQSRTYRAGTVDGVLARMYERMQNAYQDGTDWLNAPKPWEKK